MGRTLSGQGGASGGSNGGYAGGTFNLKTGIATAINALTCMGPDGLAYPAETIDYAAKPNIGNACITAVTVVAGTPAYYGAVKSVAIGDNGDIFVGTANASGGYGFTAYRYAAGGGLLNSVNIGVFGALCYDPHMVKLANGNIACTWSTGSDLYYAVLSPTLTIVQGASLLEGIMSNQQSDMIALSGGGFMVSWTHKATPIWTRVAVFSNTGAVVTAASTVFTWTGGSGGSGAYIQLVELSNGQVAVAAQGSYTSGTYLGLALGTLTAAGAVSVAFTVVDADVQTIPVALSAFGGYLCVMKWVSGTTVIRTRVFNNALVQQGATHSQAVSANSGGTSQFKVTNDGTYFWLVENPGTNGVPFMLFRMTTAGAATQYGIGLNTSSSQYVGLFCERGRIVFTNGNSSYMQFSVFNTNTLNQEVLNTTIPGITDMQYHHAIPGGDFSFVITGGGSTASETKLNVVKYANTAVMGVATAAAAAGALVPIAALSGAYGVSPLRGTVSKIFDHTTGANIQGNKGTLLTYGAILKGF